MLNMNLDEIRPFHGLDLQSELTNLIVKISADSLPSLGNQSESIRMAALKEISNPRLPSTSTAGVENESKNDFGMSRKAQLLYGSKGTVRCKKCQTRKGKAGSKFYCNSDS